MLVITKCRKSEVDVKIANLLDSLAFSPKSGSTVVIKPNLSTVKPSPCESTSPEVTAAVIRYLQERGCNILIAETNKLGPPDKDYSFEDVVRNAGYDRFRSWKNVKIVDAAEAGFADKTVRNKTIKIPRLMDEADYYINIAKMKTHWQTQVSLCTKNQMGLTPEKERSIFHREGLSEHIASLAAAMKPDICIIDGITAMEGQGPHWGACKKTEVLMAGTDMLELDSFCCHMMGIDPESVEHLTLARKYRAGKYFDKSRLTHYRQYVQRFKRAEEIPLQYGNIYVWQQKGHGCSGCGRAIERIGSTKNPARLLRLLRHYIYKPMNLILGRIDDESLVTCMGDTICVGNCTKEYAKKHNLSHVPGCPPKATEVMDAFYRR